MLGLLGIPFGSRGGGREGTTRIVSASNIALFHQFTNGSVACSTANPLQHTSISILECAFEPLVILIS